VNIDIPDFPQGENLPGLLINPRKGFVYLGGNLAYKYVKVLSDALSHLEVSPGQFFLLIGRVKGGSFSAGMEILNMLQKPGRKAVGVVKELAASAAFVAFQGCSVRLAYPDSRFLIHNPEAMDPNPILIRHNMPREEYLQESEAHFNEISALVDKGRENLILALLKRSGKLSRKALEDILEGEKEFGVEEALKWGFLDRVIQMGACRLS